MVKISALVALFTMGSSIVASPVAANTVTLDNSHHASTKNGNLPDGMVAVGTQPDIGTSLRRGGRGGGGGDIAGVVITIAQQVLSLISGIHDDIEKRKAFTQQVVQETAAKFPGHNIVVCNVGYSLTGAGWQSVTSVTYNAAIGRDVTFDVVVFNSPKTFQRQGDGGFQNWAYTVGSNCQTNGGYINCPAH